MTQASSVPTTSRWTWLDALRGFALFGILLANVQQMLYPHFYANAPVEIVTNEPGVQLHWFLIDSLITNKFFTLFSFMFGMSFLLQRNSILSKTVKFKRVYSRRLLALGLFGILHGFFLYYADVLFIYAMSAIPLIFVHNFSANRLFRIGVVLYVFSFVLDFHHSALNSFPALSLLALLVIIGGIAFSLRKQSNLLFVSSMVVMLVAAMSFSLFRAEIAPSDPQKIEQQQSYASAIEDLDSNQPMINDQPIAWPLSDAQYHSMLEQADKLNEIKMEVFMYRLGSFNQKVEYQSDLFGFYSVFGLILYFLWRTLALFLLAAALIKWGFEKIETHQWRQIKNVGLLGGTTLAMLASAITLWSHQQVTVWHSVAPPLQNISSMLLLSGIIAYFYLNRDNEHSIKSWFAAGGRTALTIYILQSLVMATIAGHWGLALFAQLTHWQAFGVACSVFFVLVCLSVIWLKFFTMGPLEWLWRCFTYLSWVPIRKPN